ncbi:hypothetical protein QBC46DRAFT_177793 [Diplogelasinospora grovesii]|uniref:Uncharacterized protein n=1 Tax=Diplogelasinospora grovesii TaxID=303347 RepID=A0AAN6N3J8_9PEZI|nr:hypothetical protein QBC46DRAFT_177793 [Diplogelasinospora grovesii]
MMAVLGGRMVEVGRRCWAVLGGPVGGGTRAGTGLETSTGTGAEGMGMGMGMGMGVLEEEGCAWWTVVGLLTNGTSPSRPLIMTLLWPNPTCSSVSALPFFLDCGLMMRFGAPPDPITSGNRISRYSSWSNDRSRSCLARASFYEQARPTQVSAMSRNRGGGQQAQNHRHRLKAYLAMSVPRVLGRRHHPGLRIVRELGILPQAPPQPELLAGIVALVYEMVLTHDGAMLLGQRMESPVPGLGFEGAALAQPAPD